MAEEPEVIPQGVTTYPRVASASGDEEPLTAEIAAQDALEEARLAAYECDCDEARDAARLADYEDERAEAIDLDRIEEYEANRAYEMDMAAARRLGTRSRIHRMTPRRGVRRERRTRRARVTSVAQRSSDAPPAPAGDPPSSLGAARLFGGA
jgi:hypothetical protein